MHTIYLCGAMHGLTYEEAIEPHDYVEKFLGSGFTILSPMRNVPEWKGPKNSIVIEESRDGAEVIMRDLADIKQCSILLVTGKRAGMGSHAEVGAAWALGKIIMEVGADEGSWIHTLSDVHFPCLMEAILVLNKYWREEVA